MVCCRISVSAHGTSPQGKFRFLQQCCLRAEAKMLYLQSVSNQSFRKVLAFVGSCRPHWQFLSCEKKGTKDSQGTSWFLDLQQKGALPPLDTPNDARSFCGKRGGASRSDCGGDFPPRRYQRGSILFDTLLDTFLVKEKYPQGWAA